MFYSVKTRKAYDFRVVQQTERIGRPLGNKKLSFFTLFLQLGPLLVGRHAHARGLSECRRSGEQLTRPAALGGLPDHPTSHLVSLGLGFDYVA